VLHETIPSTRPETASSAIHSAFQQLKVTFPALKDEQEEAAVAILQGKDVFVQLPTGYGKIAIRFRFFSKATSSQFLGVMFVTSDRFNGRSMQATAKHGLGSRCGKWTAALRTVTC
jgi:superfamily II DNA or RNA helicase